jgi:hypothetical protein
VKILQERRRKALEHKGIGNNSKSSAIREGLTNGIASNRKSSVQQWKVID